MHTENFSDTRSNLKAVLDKVVADRIPIKIMRQRGQEAVVMISASEWDSIEETLHLLASPANARHLQEGIDELDAGKGAERTLMSPKG